MKCRFCQHKLHHEFIDLGATPPSNSFLTKDQLNEPEVFYPLKLYVCENCFLVQVDEYKKSAEIFNQNYAYFSSFSTSWLEHAKKYVALITEKLELTGKAYVIEIASNDGYLLQYFKEKQIPCLGIEPSANTAKAAREKGIETLEAFFGVDLAQRLFQQGKTANLIIGNNVLAHVPDINDFVAGLKIVLKNDGVVTMEFPHLMRLVEENQFDTIYHEHFSYFSFHTVRHIFANHGLIVFDVEEIPTHGGSLRIYAGHHEDNSKPITKAVAGLLKKETAKGMLKLDYYQNVQQKADKVKYELLEFLIEQKIRGKKVVAYGAAAKGNTLLNYCGVKRDLIEFVVDASPHKRGKFTPGSHIPIVSPSALIEYQPDWVVIFPWNIANEVIRQQGSVRDWGGKFVVAVPELELL
ncbi:MAG: class I SAM-dependent methyltransferase [Desulfobacterales bacterium]|jgi:SAM-dependent methyltransferase